MKIYSIYDTKAKIYKQTFFAVTGSTETDLLRSLEKIINTEGNDYHDFAEDFILYSLGDLNIETGELTQNIESIVKFISLLKKED